MPDSLLFTNSIQKCLKIKRWTYFSEKKINYHLFRLTSSCETWNSLKSKRFLSNKKRIILLSLTSLTKQCTIYLLWIKRFTNHQVYPRPLLQSLESAALPSGHEPL